MTTSFVWNTVIESGQRYASLESIELIALGFEVVAPILEGQSVAVATTGSSEMQESNKGSIHSDHWSGTDADPATRDAIGIFPVRGWWRQYPGRERWQSSARYSLAVSVRAPAADVDIYTPVMNQKTAQIQTEI